MADDRALEIIRGLEGVIDAFYLDRDILERVKVEESVVRAAGEVSVINEGVNQALERERVICIIKDPRFRPPPEPTVILKSTDGQVMGIEVFPETSGEYAERGDAIFVSDGFVMFPSVMPSNGQTENFVMPPIPFPELNEAGGFRDVISCSPSPTSDDMIRRWHGLEPNGKYASILVAYNTSKER
ncbi:MAG: hypothetical protein MJY64_02835 [archaeon]|nr:hypothetical protein [archaeon]